MPADHLWRDLLRHVADGIHLHRVTEQDWAGHRELRLQMLRDAPDHFWTTLSDVEGLGEQEWRDSLGRVDHVQARRADHTVVGGLGLLSEAYDVGLELPADAVHLVAMYVVPSARGSGVGDLLLAGAKELAAHLDRPRILLEVTSSNEAAIALYERNGFRFTGSTTPHPRRADLLEREMVFDPAR